MTFKYHFLFIFCLLVAGVARSQEKLQDTKNYTSGEQFLAPLYGLKVTVPTSWTGFYPKESEIFMMANDSAQAVECMYFANQSDLKTIQANWKKGFLLAQGLTVELEGKISTEDDGLTFSKIALTNRPDVKGVVLAKCGTFGVCVTAMVYGPAPLMESYFANLAPVLTGIDFVKPTPSAELDRFDWQKELTGKYILAYQRDQSSKKESQVWLYLDGTFKSKISRTGMFKGSAGKYKGTKKGTYLIYNEDQGEPAKLVLLYKGLPEVVLPLTKKDDQYFINGQVFYFSQM
ncbi:hypothetical protein N7E81_05365 [Reichenbachiella carrageenanivorans]|uniref:Lipocalin-like domain-containing protein n=1 Tax=Reichenbachiella carrageenanivorans TaxID=2979869 RepID=A0ABY6D2Y8_9BACT|nr:hypothetical protein [Reichenbachiella carrageenanivorans]UXX80527.1 hypothetical protein N7E81_05365 [Reichenbachiella carrageenanivorans]